MRLALTASLGGLLLAACSSSVTSVTHPTPSPSPLPARYDAYVGAYRGDSGAVLVVNAMGDLVNLRDGFIRRLYPTATPDQLTYGPAYEVSSPRRGDVAFHVVGGRADEMTLTPAAGPALRAPRLRFKETEVRIAAGDATLAGTITEPLAPGPHPGIVIIHGSEPGQRSYYGVWVGLYAALGLTVLSYDKRGNGRSTGTYPGEAPTDASLTIYADDASSALRFLAAWPGVDRARVGFHGGSQGGWTVPLAIHRGAPAAFAVLVSGPAVTTGQQAAWAGLVSGTAGAPMISPSDMAQLRTNQLGYDPTTFVSQIRQPVLWLNGAADRSVPTDLNVEILQGMHRANFDVEVLPKTDHGMLEDPSGSDTTTATRLSPGLFDRIAAWLAMEVGTLPAP